MTVQAEKVKSEDKIGSPSGYCFARVDRKVIMDQSLSSRDLHIYVVLCAEAGRERNVSLTVKEIGELAACKRRNFTLNKLEKQFGMYQPSQENMKPDTAVIEKLIIPQPLDPMSDDDKWRKYILTRNEHFKNSKQVQAELDMTQKKEHQVLKDRHHEERAELFHSLGGKGLGRSHINRQSSLLAALHAAETVTLKQEHKTQREKLRHVSSALQSYESWLRNQGLTIEADAWRYRKNNTFLEMHAPHDAVERKDAKRSGILSFCTAVTGQGVKFYSGESTQAAFIDMGKRIRVYRHDDDALLAALQLAQEKWGGVQLGGSDEYKRRCVEVAVKNGIHIANPELRETTVTASETPEEKAQRMAEISKIMRQKAMELARKYIPEGMIIITGAQDGKTYSGSIIGVVSHDGYTHALQKISESQVIQHSVTNVERTQVE